MKIQEAIDKIKAYHKGVSRGEPIDPVKTRDQILYGDPDQELRGIVTTCFASYEVIGKAIAAGANLIICHEAIFWNHGDQIDWLRDNKTFQAKTRLMDSAGVVVWRDHDFIHSGIPMPDGSWADGIFFGLMKVLGWERYLQGSDGIQPSRFQLPATTVRELGRELMEKLPLNGIKVIGSLDSPVSKVWFPGHVMGMHDNDILKTMEEDDFDTLIVFECTDYTVTEYVRDSTQAGRPKTILAVGHFNTEEPGMQFMTEYLPTALGESVPCRFIPSTDMYQFLVKE